MLPLVKRLTTGKQTCSEHQSIVLVGKREGFTSHSVGQSGCASLSLLSQRQPWRKDHSGYLELASDSFMRFSPHQIADVESCFVPRVLYRGVCPWPQCRLSEHFAVASQSFLFKFSAVPHHGLRHHSTNRPRKRKQLRHMFGVSSNVPSVELVQID